MRKKAFTGFWIVLILAFAYMAINRDHSDEPYRTPVLTEAQCAAWYQGIIGAVENQDGRFWVDYKSKCGNNAPIVKASSLLVPELEAQAPPIPSGQTAVTGAQSSTTSAYSGTLTGSAPAPDKILFNAPSPTSNRNYLYQAQCFSTSGTATVAVLIDSSTTGLALGRSTIGYVNCPASAASNYPAYFNPPLALRPGSALGISSIVAVTTAFFYASGFVGR